MLPATRKPKTRKARSFKPTSDGLEARLQLTATAGGALALALPVHVGPIAPPVVVATPEADIVLSNLTVQSLGNNQFKVTATLVNDGIPQAGNAGGLNAEVVRTLPLPPVNAGISYPGGGTLQITRTNGGTILNAQPTGSVLSTPVSPQIIASMPIPALNYHQSIQLTTVTQGRAIFTASAVPTRMPVGVPPAPFPDANLNDNSKTVDSLVQHTYPVNTTTLGLVPAISNAVNNAQLRLDATNSMINIPGVINTTFKIPAQSVSIGFGPFTYTAKYYVDNLVSTSAALSYEQGGLAITVKFADNAHALHTTSSVLPDIGVTGLQVKIFLPLSYNAQYQYFQIGTARTVVTGNWQAGGPFGSVVDLLLPNINQKVSSAVTSLVNSEQSLLSYELTKPIHDFVGDGRIVSANIQQDQMLVTIETQN